MKKTKRIKKSYEFQTIIEQKKYQANDQYVIYYQPKKELEHRIGISVGKKIGNAVTRNKIKRQVRMMVLEKKVQNLAFDCIIIVRPKYLKKDFKENSEKLFSLIDKIKSKEGEKNE